MISECEEGIIIKIHGDIATVRVKSSSLCSHCKACIMGDDGYMTAEAENTIGAKIGDKVGLSVNSKMLLGSSLLVFGLPLLVLLISVILADLVFDNQIFSLSIGLALFFLSFIPIKIYDKHLRKTNVCGIKIVEIIEDKP